MGTLQTIKKGAQTILSSRFDQHEVTITLEDKKIFSVTHSALTKELTHVLSLKLRGQNAECLRDLSVGEFYRICQKALNDLDDDAEEDLVEELENIVDDVEMGEFPIIYKPIEELRSLYFKYVLPETNGQFLSMGLSDLQICRCTGVTEKEIGQFIKDNPESTLGELNAETGAGVGCGSCMSDVKSVFDSCFAKNSPTPLEWLIIADEQLRKIFGDDWGTFEGLNEETVLVRLQKINQEQFSQITERLPLLSIKLYFQD